MKHLKTKIGLVCVIAFLTTVAFIVPDRILAVKAENARFKMMISTNATHPEEPANADTVYFYGDSDDYFDSKSYTYYLHVYSENLIAWTTVKITGINYDGITEEPASGFCDFACDSDSNSFSIMPHSYSSGGMANIWFNAYDGNNALIGNYNLTIKVHTRKVTKKIYLYNWLVPVNKTYGGKDGYSVQTPRIFERLEKEPEHMEPDFTGVKWQHDSDEITTLDCQEGNLTTEPSFKFTSNELGVDHVTSWRRIGMDGNIVASPDSSAGTCEIIVAEITPTKEGTIDTSQNLQTICFVGNSVDSPAVITPSGEGLTYKWGIYDSSESGDDVYTTSQSNDYIRLNSDFTITGLKETPSGSPVTVWAEIIEPQDGNYWNYPDKIRCTWDVEVVKIPVTVSAGIIRYTGRKMQNSLAVDIADSATCKDNKGNTVTDLDLSDKLDSAVWTPSKGKAAFDDGKLTPKSVGNEKLTAPVSVSSDKYSVAGGKATLNADIYGYQFTGKTELSWIKGSKKDLDYTIELASPASASVATGSSFKDNSAIFDELVRVEIMDKDEKKLICTLTDNGEKEGVDYDLTSGSVKINLKSTYLETLDSGTYKIIGYFKPAAEGGNEVDTLNVAAFTVNSDPAPSPGTGESQVMIVLCLVFIAISGAYIASLMIKRRMGKA